MNTVLMIILAAVFAYTFTDWVTRYDNGGDQE